MKKRIYFFKSKKDIDARNVPADKNQPTINEIAAELLSKLCAALVQPCRYLMQEAKNLYYLGKEVKKNCDPVLKTVGNLIHDICMAAHENWKTKEIQRKFTETCVLQGEIFGEASDFIRANPFPQAVPIDTSDTLRFKIKTVGIGMYEILIPLKSPQELPNGLFPHYTTDTLNAALEDARLYWDLTHSPADHRPRLYYMKIAGMRQPNNVAAIIQIRLLQW